MDMNHPWIWKPDAIPRMKKLPAQSDCRPLSIEKAAPSAINGRTRSIRSALVKIHFATTLRDVGSGAAMLATPSANSTMSSGPDHFVRRSDNKKINSAYCD
jgi:hypothetical protein